ncbi:metallo-beta-lactamase family protein [Cordyceps fumosorosea ARSEF 2679]|uniref:Metallo-beta-lactamase family protein n=1 Tax=Cordyceps fumosorosea (strain ARSEF 2679) TaxID=1081104 RepID=A0A168BQH3_CORFA|nr:metallo-beta-lactamase family protein [Cordyceps fumosorosea ARSEF 2679]OAA70421.1 metallo-beta-lactamase family protein [Cordyceps fumosorosea ARSEF 2679]
MASSSNLCVCVTCGTQFGIPYEERPPTCRMCDEPRQFVPPSGQSWTTLARMQSSYRNEIKQDDVDGRIWSIFSSPQFAIGQRAILVETEAGNVLWDCVSLLDAATVAFVRARGGLKAIAISHPHFYSTHLEWAREFDCPVYLAEDDREWLNREDVDDRRRFVSGLVLEILPGVNIIKLGGHFPGSSALHWNKNLFVGDSIGISQSGLVRSHHNKRHQTFFFHYAFPNFIPLGPTAMLEMWKRLESWEFESLFSLFYRTTVRDPDVKSMVLDSMQRQARHQENNSHPLLDERWRSKI